MMTVPIVPIGNSRGIRIPKKMLDALGSPESVNLELREGVLVVRPIANPRAAWDDEALWRNAKLTREDREWLDSELTNEDNVE
ncbi:MAG: AbrB/MazE/SpoVT family DNA-binding domain-containing protein [Chloroflexi bacterium]|nr:AbrB/MazE/SpoVT family DNA-binding domain-containing protein [Chloroflexota bacterium]